MRIRKARKAEKMFALHDKRYFDENDEPKWEDKRFKRFIHFYAKAITRLNQALHFGRFLRERHERYKDVL